MKKEFITELTELINKHGLESEMRDTPDYILAQVCVDAMAVFTESIARRDEWHGFRKADRKKPENFKFPEDCKKCDKRFKCISFLLQEPISNLTERLQQTDDKEEINTIALAIQERQNEKPDDNSNISKSLKDGFAVVMLYGWDKSEKKPTFKKNPKESPKEEKPAIEENETDLRKRIGEVLQELSQIGDNVKITFIDKNTGTQRMLTPIIQNENDQK